MSYPVSLQDLVDRAHDNSRTHGFWDAQFCTDLDEQKKRVEKIIPEKLMLIVSETAEALEDYREGKMVTLGKWPENYNKSFCGNCPKEVDPKTLVCANCGWQAKPVGFPSELADIVIRVFDLAGALGINLEQEVLNKMAYNETRPHKHGKVC